MLMIPEIDNREKEEKLQKGHCTLFMARSQNLWVKSIRKSGVMSWECAGRAALSLSHSPQSRSQRRATASECAPMLRIGLEP